MHGGYANFYSRPCGRGDDFVVTTKQKGAISTHAPAGGATWTVAPSFFNATISTHAPAGGATEAMSKMQRKPPNFYSRPCGRGDIGAAIIVAFREIFLLTPLREGRLGSILGQSLLHFISTHAPAGGATFLYSDSIFARIISTHAPAGGATFLQPRAPAAIRISTHAPAGGATAIFHKFVMRFCGKLPKDDTVLCLASFGFPRRDPKAVYLAWISCANLPQKCVREGLALKDQGTSCFHEGLASHAFDPVLV